MAAGGEDRVLAGAAARDEDARRGDLDRGIESDSGKKLADRTTERHWLGQPRLAPTWVGVLLVLRANLP
jgi:hypothetical protein